MSTKHISRREFLGLAAGLGGAALLAACGPTPMPQTVEVEKVVTKEVEKVVKETVEVEKVVKETVVVTAAAPTRFKEAPMLADQVKAGKLPPVDQRLPLAPVVIDPVEAVGQYGGTMRMVAGDDGMGWLRMTIGTESLVKWKRDVSGIDRKSTRLNSSHTT